MTEETTDGNRAFYKALTRWIIDQHAQRMAGVLIQKDATPTRYEEEFANCCADAFEGFRLRDCGYKDLADFMEDFGPAFKHFLETYRRIRYLSGEAPTDVADFLRWEEQLTHAQTAASPEEKQEMWDASLELHKDAIPISEKYRQRIKELSQSLRRTGAAPGDVSKEDLHSTVLSKVYEAIMEATGPKTRKQGTRAPRLIQDVLGFGCLRDKMRREYRDGQRVKDKEQGSDQLVYHDRLDVEELAGDDDLTLWIDAAEDRARLVAAISALPPEKRLLVDVLAGEITQTEAAEQLGVSQGTVSNRLKKLKIELQEKLSE